MTRVVLDLRHGIQEIKPAIMEDGEGVQFASVEDATVIRKGLKREEEEEMKIRLRR